MQITKKKKKKKNKKKLGLIITRDIRRYTLRNVSVDTKRSSLTSGSSVICLRDTGYHRQLSATTARNQSVGAGTYLRDTVSGNEWKWGDEDSVKLPGNV